MAEVKRAHMVAEYATVIQGIQEAAQTRQDQTRVLPRNEQGHLQPVTQFIEQVDRQAPSAPDRNERSTAAVRAAVVQTNRQYIADAERVLPQPPAPGPAPVAPRQGAAPVPGWLRLLHDLFQGYEP